MSMIRKFSRIPAAAVLSLGVLIATGLSVNPAFATATLKLDDGVNPVLTIADGSGSDTSGAAGVVQFIGSIGNWDLAVATGSVLGSPQSGLNLTWSNLWNLTGAAVGPGTLKMLFSEVGFTNAGPTLEAFLSAGGTNGAGSTVSSLNVWADSGNTLFGMTTSVFSAGPFAPPPAGWNYDDINSALGGLSAPYSLTIEVDLTASGSSVDNTGSVTVEVPEPVTSALLGLSLVGLGLARRRVRKG